MSGVNKVILIGHLGRDPEIRTTQSGDRVATFSLATSETWRDKATGERKEATEWHKVVIFTPGLVEVAERYLKKGSKAYVEGKLRTRKWTDQAGVERYTTEIVLAAFSGTLTLLDRRERDPGAEGEDAYGAAPPDAGSGPAGSTAPTSRRDDLDDDIPF